MYLYKVFQRRWLIPTLFVLAGAALCIRLGFWQLDRLEQRRGFNRQFETMQAMPPLDLNQALPGDISNMEWRSVRVEGEYDYKNQVALRNQYYGSQVGYHLLTPLRFVSPAGSGRTSAVLVDRGWIPADGHSSAGDWRKYDEPGAASLRGQIRLGQAKPVLGGVTDLLPEDGGRLEIWSNADMERIASQLPYPVLPVYIQPEVDLSDSEPPIPFQPAIEVTEGPHFGYALQWFTFATILLVGYPIYLRKQEVK